MHGSKDPMYAGDLLISTKTSVRNLAIAITESATPQVRAALTQQLNQAIQLHSNVFSYMLSRSYYPAYDVQQVIRNDLANAHRALSTPIRPGP